MPLDEYQTGKKTRTASVQTGERKGRNHHIRSYWMKF